MVGISSTFSIDVVGCILKMSSFRAVAEERIGEVIACLWGDFAVLDQLKVLQILLVFCTTYKTGTTPPNTVVVNGELLSSCLQLCYKFSTSPNAVLSNPSSATFKQLFLHTFERLVSIEEEDSRAAYEHDALALFKVWGFLRVGYL